MKRNLIGLAAVALAGLFALPLSAADKDKEAAKEETLRQDQGKPWTFGDIVNKLVDCCDE